MAKKEDNRAQLRNELVTQFILKRLNDTGDAGGVGYELAQILDGMDYALSAYTEE